MGHGNSVPRFDVTCGTDSRVFGSDGMPGAPRRRRWDDKSTAREPDAMNQFMLALTVMAGGAETIRAFFKTFP
jgi:hypothetical protein